MIYFWVISKVSDEQRAKIDRVLYRDEIEAETVQYEGRIKPPSWWLGDEEASESSQAAMMQMRM